MFGTKLFINGCKRELIGTRYLNIVRIAEVAGEMAHARTNVYHISHVHLHNYIHYQMSL
jgi:hypothetical protein